MDVLADGETSPNDDAGATAPPAKKRKSTAKKASSVNSANAVVTVPLHSSTAEEEIRARNRYKKASWMMSL
jgi:hypothetical protein